MLAEELATKLASRARHVCMLIGAGASCAAGLPTLARLEEQVLERIDLSLRDSLVGQLDGRNLEAALSRIRRVSGLLEPGENVGGLTGESAAELDSGICEAIMGVIETADADLGPFERLASWAGRMDYQRPLELFTVNYDLLIEKGLEAVGVPYFDGFIGTHRAPLMAELVEPRDAPERWALPAGFARVWKLHGSTNWRVLGDSSSTIVRVGRGDDEGSVAIYPSDEKYEESRRVPFVVLMDRFRRALVEPETITITSGFSFGDDHLNEMLFDAADRHPRSEVLALCFDEIPDSVAHRASRTRNLVALGRTEAIVNGRRAPWSFDAEIPGIYEAGEFLLGDFGHLTSFLARQVGSSDEVD
ncbi:MAG: SIR2 family protein [Acidimicrobiales bacterium]|nr:MAG: SIR2 family protein [Acidimicrobiales bacterium]